MILLKSIIRKNNFKWYAISFVLMFGVLISLKSLNLKLIKEIEQNKNNIEYRTIKISDFEDKEIDKLISASMIDEINKNEGTVIIKDYCYLNDIIKILESNNLDFEYNEPQIEGTFFNNILKNIIIVTELVLLIVIMFFTYQFYKEDFDIQQLLHNIGYSYNRIFIMYLGIFLTFIILTFLIGTLIGLIVNNVILESIFAFSLSELLIVLIVVSIICLTLNIKARK